MRAQDHENLEILILDNNSSDDTVGLLRNESAAKLYESRINTGFAAGVNFLADKAAGQYLFILNPDCTCEPDCISRLIEFSESNPGAISAALRYPDGSPQLSAREIITYENVIFSRKSLFYKLGLTKLEKAGYLAPEEPTKVPAVSATALLLKRGDFDNVGGFDERFFLYLEDIDFCRRLTENGIDIWYLPEIVINHSYGKSSENSRLAAVYHHHLSMFKYFTKYQSDKYIKNTLLMILLLAGFIVSVAGIALKSGKSHD